MVSEAFKSLNTMSNKEVLILVLVEDGLRERWQLYKSLSHKAS